MRVQRPIFINGISRGGTTILLNLVASHPDVALVGETHKVFKGCRQYDNPLRVLYKTAFRELPVLARLRQDYFSPRRDVERPLPSPVLRRHIDRCMFAEQLRRHPNLNRDKSPSEKYARNELRAARMLAKNLDGAIFLTDVFDEMYSDATFISLVRNGLAICEGHVRRGKSAEDVGRRYQLLVGKMLNDSQQCGNHTLVRFEDLLERPRDVAVTCCQAADLDVWQLGAIRQQTRRVLQGNGEHIAAGKEWEVNWTPLSELAASFDHGVDDRQISKLAPADRDAFLKVAGDTMERLGYATTGDCLRRTA